MKKGKVHRVPLSDAAMSVLENAKALGGDDAAAIFASPDTGEAPSDNTLLNALHKVAKKATMHGFRSSFTTWAEEKTDAKDTMIKVCKAHDVGDATEKAYNRAEYLEARRILMQAWADYVAG